MMKKAQEPVAANYALRASWAALLCKAGGSFLRSFPLSKKTTFAHWPGCSFQLLKNKRFSCFTFFT